MNPPAFSLDSGENECVGRERQIEDVLALLCRGRSVVLSGAPGVGKTRVATECIQRLGEGAVVSLTDVTDAAELVGRVADAVGAGRAPATTRSEAEDRLLRALTARGGCVLVLDGFERLPVEADGLLGEWIGSGLTRFLITSRRKLSAPVEDIELGPLAIEPEREGEWSTAARMLAIRSQEVARVRLREEDSAAVHALARALDGLPLALELAAARLGVLTPEQLLDRLNQRAPMLAGLGSAIGSSYSALNDDAKACLVACAVFEGGIQLEALEAVAPLDIDVVAALMAARNHSLLAVERVDTALRYRLPQSVRDFVLELARGSEEWQLARLRHAEYWDRRAPQLLSEPAEARTELGNLRAAFELGLERNLPLAGRLALILSDPIVALPYAVAREIVTRALGHEEFGTRLRLRQGALNRILSDFDAAKIELRRAAELAEIAEDLPLQAEVEVELGCTASALARWEQSRAHFSRALELHPAESFRALTLAMIANTHVNEDAFEYAEPLFREAITLGEKHGDTFAEAFARLSLGVLLVERGDFDEAFAELEEAMSIVESGRDLRFMHSRHLSAVALTHIARVRQESGDLSGALVDYHRARQIAEQEGARRAEAFVLCGLAGLLLEMGELHAADDQLRVALPLMRENCRDNEGVLVAFRGVFFALQGAPDDAERLFARAESLLDPGGRRVFSVALRILRGQPLEAGSPLERFADVRLAERLRALFSDKPAEKPLLVASDASFFRISNHDQAVLLGRRRAVRGVLRALVNARNTQPGVPVSIETLVEAGWPGERILPAAAAGRVYTAIATLRRLGLRGVVEQTGTGYLIPPQIPVVLHDQTG